jgi:hypothetical protein
MSIEIRPRTALVLASLTTVVVLMAAAPGMAGQKVQAWSPTITLANNEETLALKVGGRFLLDLGAGYDWNIQIGDSSIVSRVPNIMVIKGAQGIYEAHKTGSTALTATGDPLCRKAVPQCAAPSRLFTLKIQVRSMLSSSYQAKLAACNSIPNNSTQTIKPTTRLFINLPKDIYPNKLHNLQFKKVRGNATAGWISNAGPYGDSIRATPACWSYYLDFEGSGEIDLKVQSKMKGMPNYFVRFVVLANL